MAMATTVQSVVIGNTVYVGGGDEYNHLDTCKCTIMKFDLEGDDWSKLPQYNAEYFAMTSFANQLVLVGGYNPVKKERTDEIAALDSEKWTHPYPPMKIARSYSTAVCFNNYIIVSGGENDVEHISSVEVLDPDIKRWYFAESMPNPRSELKSALVENTLYLMGGKDINDSSTKTVYKVDANELIAKAVSKQATPTLWHEIKDAPLEFSTPLSISGSLLAIGGCDHDNASKFIYLYQPNTEKWVKVGDLPFERYNCTCSVLPTGEIIVAGGQTSEQSDTYYLTAVTFLAIDL